MFKMIMQWDYITENENHEAVEFCINFIKNSKKPIILADYPMLMAPMICWLKMF